MLKRIIMLLTIFVIANNINCAHANTDNINRIIPVTHQDLINADFDACQICYGREEDISNLYKANCPSMDDHPHIFHRDCILGWMSSGRERALDCPVCRGAMVAEDINAALINASLNGNLGAVRLLIERGANVNAQDNNGKTALIWASFNGNLEVVILLI